MKRHIRGRNGAACLCALLAGLLLCLSGARADLLLFATAEDCEAAELSGWTLNMPHAVVLQKVNAAGEKKARKALKQAGVEEVAFLGLAGIKNRTAEALKKKWATKANTARIASLIRQHEDGCIVYFAANEQDRLFLADFADRCAAGANDPFCRMGKKQQDEYLHEVPLIIDGTTGKESAASPADESWRENWEDRTTYDLSALPETDGDGFLPEGEYVLEDAGQGLWVYLSPTLRVVVTAHRKSGYSWFEADVLRRPEGETLHMVTSLNRLGNDPAKVAADNRLVLGVNGDYHQIRINYKKKTGLIIRGGKLVRESNGPTNSKAFPPMDTLLLDADGGFRLDKAGELDSEKAFALGAVDVLSFGPILVKDGRIRVLVNSYHEKKEPRTAVGWLGENHYLLVVAEGRMPNANGMGLDELGRLMAARGCTEAFNLDGGHTSALIFMGKRLNKIGNLSGTGMTAPRNMAELLGIGTYGEDAGWNREETE